MMHALAESHMFVHCLKVVEFLRSAYYWRFDKDITDKALRADSDAFQKSGNVPPYVVDYLIHIYGVN